MADASREDKATVRQARVQHLPRGGSAQYPEPSETRSWLDILDVGRLPDHPSAETRISWGHGVPFVNATWNSDNERLWQPRREREVGPGALPLRPIEPACLPSDIPVRGGLACLCLATAGPKWRIALPRGQKA